MRKFLRLLSARVKIRQISHVQFCNDSSSNVGSFFFAMTHNSSVLFWCETLYTLHKGTNQSGNFENFESSGQNF